MGAMQVIKIFYFIVVVVLGSCTTREGQDTTVNIHVKNSPHSKIEQNPNIVFRQHTVRAGETIFAISKLYNVSIAEIVLDNQLKKEETVLAGRVLKIRASGNQPQSEINRNTSFEKKYEEIQHQPSSSSQKPIGKVFLGEVAYSKIPPSNGYSKTINGNVIAGFDTLRGNRPLMGVELRSSSNQQVKAVHNGIVSFLSDDFAGYGRCVGISNNRQELVFIYGLNSFKVKIGDVVTKGMAIGTIEGGKVLGLKILRQGNFQNPALIISGM